MKKISQAIRLEYWKFLCADFSFEKAKSIASHLLNNPYYDELFYPLLTSLYVFYGRPFKQKKRVRLPKEMVPRHFMSLHETLIDLRDKSFAHVDYSGIPEKGLDDLNKIMIKIEGATVTGGIANQIPQGLQLKNVISLCEELQNKCSYHLQKIWNKTMDNWFPQNGKYEVNLAKGDAYLIKDLEIREPVIPPDAITRR